MTDDLVDAADRAHNVPWSEQANAEMQRVYEENERLHRIVARLTDRLGQLHDAGLDASGDAVDWRARAVEQEAEAARLRAERDALQAQLDAGLDDCLEMHAAYVKVERELAEARIRRQAAEWARDVLAEANRDKSRWSSVWKRAAKKWWERAQAAQGKADELRAEIALMDQYMDQIEEERDAWRWQARFWNQTAAKKEEERDVARIERDQNDRVISALNDIIERFVNERDAARAECDRLRAIIGEGAL